MEAMAGNPVMLGPLWAHFVFYEHRPKSHARKNGELKPGAPMRPTKAPDLDKLIRSCGDALNGVAWKDDSQLAVIIASKVYTDDDQPYSGVSIAVGPIEKATDEFAPTESF